MNLFLKAKNESYKDGVHLCYFCKVEFKPDIIEKLDETNYQIFQSVSMKYRYWLENDVLPDYQISTK